MLSELFDEDRWGLAGANSAGALWAAIEGDWTVVQGVETSG